MPNPQSQVAEAKSSVGSYVSCVFAFHACLGSHVGYRGVYRTVEGQYISTAELQFLLRETLVAKRESPLCWHNVTAWEKLSPGHGKRARKKDPEGPDSAVHRLRNVGQNHAADQRPPAPHVGRPRICVCVSPGHARPSRAPHRASGVQLPKRLRISEYNRPPHETLAMVNPNVINHELT